MRVLAKFKRATWRPVDAEQCMLARARASDGRPRGCCRILYVRNLPFNISADEMYDIFGKFGAVRQIRLCAPDSCVCFRSCCTCVVCCAAALCCSVLSGAVASSRGACA